MKQFEKLRKLINQIPKSKVTTYKALGRELGIHPRVVGRLLSQNPDLSGIACYRVILSNGRLGGYRLGAEEKLKRLRSEGIEISSGRIDLSRYEHFFRKVAFSTP